MIARMLRAMTRSNAIAIGRATPKRPTHDRARRQYSIAIGASERATGAITANSTLCSMKPILPEVIAEGCDACGPRKTPNDVVADESSNRIRPTPAMIGVDVRTTGTNRRGLLCPKSRVSAAVP